MKENEWTFETVNAECDEPRQRGGIHCFFIKISVGKLQKFAMGAYTDELKVKAPTLLRILVKLISKNEHRNWHKHGDIVTTQKYVRQLLHS